jgi:transposase-like protein
MSFVPPRCPYRECVQHAAPITRFASRWGSYHPRCRSKPVQRYRCRSCRRTFSRQTFRHDRRDRRPQCNKRLFQLLTSGVGQRQSARLLGLALRSVQKKMRKLAATCASLHENLSPRLPAGLTYVMDEEETYEGASIRPLTMPVLVEKDSWFVVATSVGSIRRLAPAGSARRRRQDCEEKERGARKDESNRCVGEVLQALGRRVDGELELRTDQKASYATIARQVFGERVRHATTAGTRIRTTHNPLFPINATLAMTRDNCGRLRRRSWLVTKHAPWLQLQMALFTVYRNYVRRRFNRDARQETPARCLGLLPRQLRVREVLRWRQDWGARSPHPLSFRGDRAMA